MTKLEHILNLIKTEKEDKIVPENIKKGIEVFEVTGTYEGEGSSTIEGVKLFKTEEEMQADETAKEGDLAVVYRSEIQNATVDSQFSSATFPKTVVLPQALTDQVEVEYRAVDSSAMFSCMGYLNANDFMMDCYTDTGSIQIMYESADGITYTRTDSGDETVDFGAEIYFYREDYWNDAIGYFIQTGGINFGGLFEYTSYTDSQSFRPVMIKDIIMDGLSVSWNNTYADMIVDKSKLLSIGKKILDDIEIDETKTIWACLKDGKWNIFAPQSQYSSYSNMYIYGLSCKNNDGVLIPVGIGSNQGAPSETNLTTKPPRRFEVDLDEQTYTDLGITSVISYKGDDYYFSYADFIPDSIMYQVNIPSNTVNASSTIIIYLDTTSHIIEAPSYTSNYVYFKYLVAPTQLSITPDYVYEKEFYGKNGLETGSLTEVISTAIDDTNAEIYLKLKNFYDDLKDITISSTSEFKSIFNTKTRFIPMKVNTAGITDTQGMFDYYTVLQEVNLSGFNTDNVTDMTFMFEFCESLKNIDLSTFNTSNVINMVGMFRYCENVKRLDLSNFDTSSVINCGYLFDGCSALEYVDLSSATFDVLGNKQSGGSGCYDMFRYCTSLKYINISSWDLANVSEYCNTSRMFDTIPEDCEIIVKNQAAKDWVLAKRSDLTNVQIKA